MASAKRLLGAAWETHPKSATARTYYRAQLHLGMMGRIPIRIVENPNPSKEKAPTHLVFHSPTGEGEDTKVGAFWPYKNAEGVEYLIGEINLASFGVVELKGGAKLDLRLVDGVIGVRLNAVKERRSDRSPTHRLWRMTHRSKAEASGNGEEPSTARPEKDIETDKIAEVVPSEDEALVEEPIADESF